MIGTNEQWEVVKKAEAIARIAHLHQKRKFKNGPYIEHPKAVAAAVDHPNQKTVAWLHDVLEDCPGWTAERLERCGIPRVLVREVLVLTRLHNESYYDFIMRIRNASLGLASIVKIADIDHNLHDLKPSSLRDKYQLARHILLYE